MEFHPAKSTLASEGDFLRTFAKADYRDAQSIDTRISAQPLDFRLNPGDMNTLGCQLLRGNNARGMVKLFKLATFIDPNFANAFDSEGEAYEALGETALAISAQEKAVAVDKNQVNAIARLNAQQAGGPKS